MADEFDDAIEEASSDESSDTEDTSEALDFSGTDDDVFDDSEFEPAKDGEEDESEEKVDGDKKKDKDEDEEEEEDEEERVADSPAAFLKEISDKHKGIFKEYPQLKAAVYRDIQFSKHFPSPEVAAEAAEDVEIYNKVQREFIQGNPDTLVKFFDDHKKPEQLVRFGRNLLESAGKYNKDIWAGILFPAVTGILRDAETQAKAADNKNLAASVKHLTNFLFNQLDIPADRLPAEVKTDDEGRQLASNLIQRQKIDFQEEVYGMGYREVGKVIDASLATLKCKPALKKAISQELFDKVTRALSKDSALQSTLNARWQAALKAGLGHRSKASIIDTYLAGVKNKLPKVREAVLKSNGFVIKKGVKPNSGNGNSSGARKEPEILDNRPRNAANKPGQRRDKNDLRGLSDLEKLDRIIGPVK